MNAERKKILEMLAEGKITADEADKLLDKLAGLSSSESKSEAGSGSKSEPRWRMSPMGWMATVWGVLTGVLVILLIYRSTLTMQEDDQLFLDDTKSAMEQEQAEIMSKVNKINPFVKVLGAASGLMFLVLAGMFIYQGLNNTAP